MALKDNLRMLSKKHRERVNKAQGSAVNMVKNAEAAKQAARDSQSSKG